MLPVTLATPVRSLSFQDAPRHAAMHRSASVHSASEWKLEKEANGVQVWVRPADARTHRQVKAVTTIKTSLGGMVALIKDAQAAPRWMDRVVKYEVLKTVSQHEWYTYAEIGIPWPFKNADIVTHNTLEQSPDGRVVISIHNAPAYVPKHKEKSRMERAQGSWLLTAHPDGVRVEYIFQAKPEGLSLPAWLTNSISVQSLHRSVDRLRTLAASDAYRNVRLAYIRQ